MGVPKGFRAALTEATYGRSGVCVHMFVLLCLVDKVICLLTLYVAGYEKSGPSLGPLQVLLGACSLRTVASTHPISPGTALYMIIFTLGTFCGLHDREETSVIPANGSLPCS
jgi:hypothetical protein